MLYIIDINSMRTTDSGGLSPRSPDDQILYPDVERKLREYKIKKDILVGYSSYPKISFSASMKDAWAIEIEFNKMVGNLLDDIVINGYNKEGPNRSIYQDLNKNSFMFNNIMKKHGHIKEMMTFVSGNKRDFEIATGNGIKYIPNYQFFSWNTGEMESDPNGNHHWAKHYLESKTKDVKYIVIEDVNGVKTGKRQVSSNSVVYLPKGPTYKVGE